MLMINDVRTRLQAARNRWRRVAAAPDRQRRRRLAQVLDMPSAEATSGHQVQDLTDDGFCRFGMEARLEQGLLADWQLLKQARTGHIRSAQRSTGKAFFEEVLSQQDLRAFPAFTAAALDERVLGTVLQAMGLVPHLESIDILTSTPHGASLSASQLWHYDVNDERIIKLFVYLEDCGPRNGPFTYIPAGASQRVSGMVGHYVHDELIARHVPRTQWRSVEGSAGTSFLIDTGRCYHFGSRCEAPRTAYIATYSSGLKFMRRSRDWGDLLANAASGLSPLQRAVCGLAA